MEKTIRNLINKKNLDDGHYIQGMTFSLKDKSKNFSDEQLDEIYNVIKDGLNKCLDNLENFKDF